jgi:mannose-1-phosphate guanylyltransferase
MLSVILCGGVGSRLWPLSRDIYPKPFIRLPDGQTFLKKAYLRGAGAPGAEEVLTIANRQFYFKAAEEYETSGLALTSSYILEPCGRNTAPALAAAARWARKNHGENIPLLILPSDHLIAGEERFYEAVRQARELAAQGKLVTFGIAPTRPETGFGYIETEGGKVVRFVEKPSAEKAAAYVKSGRFLWNSGMFCFQAGILLEELKTHAPELLAAVEDCLAVSQSGGDGRLELDEITFARVPAVSFDYAVMEKSDRVAVVRADDIGWSDIGSWLELCGLAEPDSDGNRVSRPEKTVLEDTRNCHVNNFHRLVATLGVEDLLIVDTDDALLVADKSRSQDVKLVYNRLKAMGHEAHRQHRTVFKPWGYYSLLEEGPRFKTKRLALKPGARISLQLHHHRSEHWIVVSGMAEVTRGEEVFFVSSNESTYIKAGTRHRVANPGQVELVLIEVQSGDYLGEDDIVRFDDAYGRA